jgi:signal recognition particle receptor subunit beta
VVFFNYTTMQMTAKIVYYGPGLGGKTTNLQYIHHKTAPRSRGEMISLETETDRTLFFDLLPLDVGVVGSMKVRLQLYTVPGQVFYNATRKLVLKGVDGIVFVADSQIAMLDANVESLRNLEANLAEMKLDLGHIPVVFQYNKRDLRNIHAVEKLDEILNASGAPSFEAAARHGIGVFETLKSISRLALSSVKKKLADDAGWAAAPPAAQPPAMRDRPAPPLPAPASQGPLEIAELLEEDVRLEFAEEGTDKHVRAVPTRDHLDIHKELQSLRALANSRSARPAAPSPSKDVERRLRDLLLPTSTARQEVKRKASVDVPAHLLKGSSSLRIHIGFDGDDQEETFRDTLTVSLVGNRKLERLTLLLELELRAKS